MKAFLKVGVTLIGLFLVCLTVGTMVLTMRFDAFGKVVLERALSYAFNTPTSIESLSFSPGTGVLEVRGLAVENPVGFERGPALKFERVSVNVDLKTLFSPTPTIQKILLENGRIDLRYELGQGSNLARLAKDAAQHAIPTGKSPKETPKSTTLPPAPSPEGSGRRFVVKELQCKDTSLKASTNLLPVSTGSIAIEPFTLTDVSKDNPLTTAELGAVVVRTLLQKATSLNGLLKPVADSLRQEWDAHFGTPPKLAAPDSVRPPSLLRSGAP